MMNTVGCLNYLKPFPRLPINFGLPLKLGAVLVLLGAMSSPLFGLSVHAGIPIVEIRGLVSKEALSLPTPALLAALDSRHLDADLRAIDPYARYIPPSLLSSKAFPSLHLGIEIFPYKSRLWIRPEAGGPAEQAGIPEIGTLWAINGKQLDNDDLAEISALLDKTVQKGAVNLVISNPRGHKAAYVIRPSALQPSSITWQRVGGDLVVHVLDFSAHETAPALRALYETVVRPARPRVIFDLRGCSGGDLYEALEIAGMFVSADLPLVSTYNRKGIARTYRAPPGKKLPSPVWVLIDRRTASAAEILAGILQHYHLTRLVGEPSFGKFVSQTIFPLTDGGEFWLTTLEVRLPDDMSHIGRGVKPDIFYPDIPIAMASDIIGKISKRGYGAH